MDAENSTVASRGKASHGLEIALRSDTLCAAFLHTGKFPLLKEDAAILAVTLLTWLQAEAKQVGVWLAASSLHQPGAASRLSDHGRDWVPIPGLAIRPGGDPPRMLTEHDLSKLPWDQMPHPRHESVVQLAGSLSAIKPSLPELAAEGGLALVASDSVDHYLAAQRDTWLPTIQDPAFRAHPFYFPLLGRQELAAGTAPLRNVLSGAAAYLCESPQDEGIAFVTATVAGMERLQRSLQQSTASRL